MAAGLATVALGGCASRPARLSTDMPESVELAIEEAQLSSQARQLPEGCWPLEPLQSIGTTRRAVAKCRVHAKAGPDQLRSGGMWARKHAILVADGEQLSYAHTREHVRASLAPIDHWSLALALIALDYTLLWDPIDESRYTWDWLETPTPSVEAVGQGWRVRWPTFRTFGCEHDLRMHEFIVSRDGEIRSNPGATRVVAVAREKICVD